MKYSFLFHSSHTVGIFSISKGCIGESQVHVTHKQPCNSIDTDHNTKSTHRYITSFASLLFNYSALAHKT